jgi:hypothetical protein
MWDDLRSFISRIKRVQSSQSTRDTRGYQKRARVAQTPKLSRIVGGRKHVVHGLINHRLSRISSDVV